MPACRPAASLKTTSEIRVDAGNLFTSAKDLESVVVGVVHGRPVYLRDVADKIVDGPAEPTDYVIVRNHECRRSSASERRTVSGRDHHRSQAQGNQRNRHCQRSAQARARDAGREPSPMT